MALTNKLNNIGDAIRTKTGKQEKLTLEQMVTEINGIPVGIENGARLFKSVEEMSANPGIPGDTGLVYNTETTNITSDMQFKDVIFPRTVIIPDELILGDSDSVHVSIQYVDDMLAGGMAGSISKTGVRLEVYYDVNTQLAPTTYINYTSTDGKTYKLDENTFMPELHFPSDVHANSWDNDIIGYFVTSATYSYNGLYNFNGGKWSNAETDLTANADSVISGLKFMGKDGVKTGTLEISGGLSGEFNPTDTPNMFDNMMPLVIQDGWQCPEETTFIPTKSDGTALLDTSEVANMTHMFAGCSSLTSIPPLDTSKVTTMNSMFSGCTKLTSIPKLNTSNVTSMEYMFYMDTITSIPKLNTSNVTSMGGMFYMSKIIIIPELDTRNVINMQAMFSACYGLSDDSLNNILLMCKNSKCSTKTLSNVGLDSKQIEKCKTLPNYQAFLDAGWKAE